MSLRPSRRQIMHMRLRRVWHRLHTRALHAITCRRKCLHRRYATWRCWASSRRSWTAHLVNLVCVTEEHRIVTWGILPATRDHLLNEFNQEPAVRIALVALFLAVQTPCQKRVDARDIDNRKTEFFVPFLERMAIRHRKPCSNLVVSIDTLHVLVVLFDTRRRWHANFLTLDETFHR